MTGVQTCALPILVFMRGLLSHLYTRIYFEDETAANAADDVLSALPPERRDTLIAKRDDTGLRFDISLQGDQETVFLHHTGQ